MSIKNKFNRLIFLPLTDYNILDAEKGKGGFISPVKPLTTIATSRKVACNFRELIIGRVLDSIAGGVGEKHTKGSAL